MVSTTGGVPRPGPHTLHRLGAEGDGQAAEKLGAFGDVGLASGLERGGDGLQNLLDLALVLLGRLERGAHHVWGAKK